MENSTRKTLNTVLTVLVITIIIFFRVRISAVTFDFQHSNFSFFWLAGRMLLEGKNPYDETQYTADIEEYGIKWHPNKIFFYPLPLAIFCIPLGFFSLPNAYLIWQALSLICVAITIFLLLNRWQNPVQGRLLIPAFIALLFFGPLYLALHTGTLGAFTLLTILIGIQLIEKKKFLLAGIVLSLIMLKPSQGLPILFLAGIWFLAKRDWKVFYGMAIGGIALLIIGMIQDPLWIPKFRDVSSALMDRTLGVHSNVWAFSYILCNGTSTCSTFLGGAGMLILLGLGGLFLWQNQAKVNAWEAFNLILPVSFVSTVYLWSYDQVSYIIPIIWIIGTLVQRTRSYIHAFVFLIVLDLFSLFALAQLALTNKDLWSLGTTLIVLSTFLYLYFSGQKQNADKI